MVSIVILLFGILISICAGEPVAALMRDLVYTDMSIVGLLSVAILPFLISAFAVLLSNLPLLLTVVFVNAFLCAHVSAGVLLTFETAGWLLCALCLFRDFFRLPILWLCWMKAADGEREAFMRCCIPGGVATGLICVFEYCIVSPFLAELISF